MSESLFHGAGRELASHSDIIVSLWTDVALPDGTHSMMDVLKQCVALFGVSLEAFLLHLDDNVTVVSGFFYMYKYRYRDRLEYTQVSSSFCKY